MSEDLFANTDLPPEFKAIIGVFALFNQIEAELEDVNIDPPLSKMEKRMLVFLDRPKRMGALADDTFCVPSAVTPVADVLETRGIVSRTRDPLDRRAWLLELTPEGEAAREYVMSEVVTRFRCFSGMNAEEIPQFANLAIKAMPGAVEAGLMEDE
ncbi:MULTISPECIES: MarR family winged helix-turn-helix transcriptional regulator [unclassified Shimia]|uniref:MarR family winged helix-turn-helix transcriptional regulator n=1 Tax=unclassified Shimia TaxID=2630038 RepID=UPI003109CC71